MLIDYWAHRHADDPKLATEEVETAGYDALLAEMEAESLALASQPGAPDAAAQAKAAEIAKEATALGGGDWETVES
jgi:hypothetical protein